MRLRHRLLPCLSALLAALSGACAAPAPTPERVPFPPLRAHDVPPSDVDVEHYAIALTLDPATRRLEGECGVRFRARRDGVTALQLDLEGLQVLGARDRADRLLPVTHADGRLTVQLAQPLARDATEEVVITYGGSPVKGLWFSGGGERGTATQVFTQGQCDESSGWFPCVDHPSDRVTSRVTATVPAGWITLAAGERTASTVSGDRRTDTWVMDSSHPCYLITLVAGELEVVEEEWNDVPLIYAAEARYAAWLEASFHETDDILAYLEEVTDRPYPYAKYSQACVANFPWGGMENVSATTLTPLTLDDELGNRDATSHELVAHEAAHQWFGDLITCNDWQHVWLNEGFATYMTLLYFEETRGRDEFRSMVRDNQEAYLRHDVGAGRQPTVWNVYREPVDLFDENVYEGAAVRLHCLRFVLGDDVFFQAVKTYVERHADGNVETRDLQRVCEEVSGRKLGWFFEQWLYRRGYPEIELAWEWDAADQVLRLDADQVQSAADGTPEVFRIPFVLEVRDARGVSTHRLELDERNEMLEVPASQKPVYVHFDVGGWTPKAVRWEKTGAEWIALAEQCTDVNARRDACTALGTLAQVELGRRPEDHELFVATLANRLRKDASPWVRASAARALGVARGLEARERLKEAAAGDASARVRVAALEALAAWGEHPDLAEFARARFDERFSWNTMGAAAGLVCAADPEGAFAWVKSRLHVPSPHDQLRERLLHHLGQLDHEDVNAELLRWVRDEGCGEIARAAAARRLAERPTERIAHSRALGELLDTRSFRLRRAVVEALAALNNPVSRELLADYYPRALNGEERRAIEAALGGDGVGGGAPPMATTSFGISVLGTPGG